MNHFFKGPAILKSRKKATMYLRGAHEELLNVQLIQKQRSSHTVNSHADMGLAIRNFQKLLDVLELTGSNVFHQVFGHFRDQRTGMLQSQGTENFTNL